MRLRFTFRAPGEGLPEPPLTGPRAPGRVRLAVVCEPVGAVLLQHVPVAGEFVLVARAPFHPKVCRDSECNPISGDVRNLHAQYGERRRERAREREICACKHDIIRIAYFRIYMQLHAQALSVSFHAACTVANEHCAP